MCMLIVAYVYKFLKSDKEKKSILSLPCCKCGQLVEPKTNETNICSHKLEINKKQAHTDKIGMLYITFLIGERPKP